MSLTNSQYDAVLRLYQEKQLRHKREQDQRIRTAFEKLPRLEEIDREVAALSLKKARILLSKQTAGDFDLDAAIRELAEERRVLLLSHGFPEDFLELRYDCPVCRDTGFVNGQKCGCFRRTEISLLYTQSNLQEILKEENFDHFRLDYYGEDLVSPSSGLTARETASRALSCDRGFVLNFSSRFENICLYGDTGVGKTFLSHCIARELIEQGFSVIYFTAFDLFELLEQYRFSSSKDMEETHQHIFDCDLLILDDLGTELTNSFVASQFFLCVNERILRKESTILSTNLSMEQFAEVYSERTFSRILSNYKMIHLFGNDIRIQKRLTGGK